MSRYEYLPKHWPDHTSFAVGWDPAMHTYFAQVMNYNISRDDGCVVVWLGALLPHYSDIDQMMQVLNKSILGRLHPVILSETMRCKLTRDRERSLRESQPRKRRGPICALDPRESPRLADDQPAAVVIDPGSAL